MFGKAAIYIVLGFSGLFLIIANNLFTFSNDAVDNYTSYFDKTISSNIASSAANIACNNLFLNSSWSSDINNKDFSGGKMTVVMNNLSFNRKEIVATSNYNGIKDTVRVMMQPSNFAKFAYYAYIMPGNLYYITGDTVWGPTHINGKLNVSGSPVFWGKVTTKSGLKKKNENDDPKFYGGYESGVTVDLPTNFSQLENAAQSGKIIQNNDVWITFKSDGTISYKIGSSETYKDTSISAFAPNGIIYVKKGDLHIKGTISGQVTVVADKSSGVGQGNIYLDDDIVYSTDPTQPNCTDMLGIVATNDIIISNTSNNRPNINIHGSLLSLKGGLTAENYSSIPPSGYINLYGGLIVYQDQPWGVFDSNNNIIHGYQAKLKYDDRFMVSAPPAFPTTGGYEIISWLE